MTLAPLQMEKLRLREVTWLVQDAPISEGRARAKPSLRFPGDSSEFLGVSKGLSVSMPSYGLYTASSWVTNNSTARAGSTQGLCQLVPSKPTPSSWMWTHAIHGLLLFHGHNLWPLRGTCKQHSFQICPWKGSDEGVSVTELAGLHSLSDYSKYTPTKSILSMLKEIEA